MDHKSQYQYQADSDDEDALQRLWLKNVGIEADEDFFQFLKENQMGQGTLLDPRIANVVSKVAKTGRISLRILYLLSSFMFEQISHHSQANKDLIISGTQRIKSDYLEHLDIFGLFSIVNNFITKPLSLTENIISKSFSLWRQSVEFGLFAAEENIRFIEALLGDTETSVVFAEFVKLFKREGWDKSVDAQIMLKKNGLIKTILITLKTLLAWIILQFATRGYGEPYEMTSVYCNFDSNVPFCLRSQPFDGAFSSFPQQNNAFTPKISTNHRSPFVSPPPFHTQANLIESDSFGHQLQDLNYKSKLIPGIDLGEPACGMGLNAEGNNSNPTLPKQSESKPHFISLSDDEWQRRILYTLNVVQSRLSEFGSSESSPGLSGTDSPSQSTNERTRSQSFFFEPNYKTSVNTKSVPSSSGIPNKPSSTDTSTVPSYSQDHDQNPILNKRSVDVLSSSAGKPKENNIDYVDFGTFSTFTTGTESAPASLPSYSPRLENVHTHPILNANKSTPAINLQPDLGKFSDNENDYDGIMVATPSDTPHINNSIYLNQYDNYPYKPLLFNIARFATFAISAYGAKFMSIMEIEKGHIDIHALLKKFGDSSENESRYSSDVEITDLSDYFSSNNNTDYNSDYNEHSYSDSGLKPDQTAPRKFPNMQHISPFSPYLKSEKPQINKRSVSFTGYISNKDSGERKHTLSRSPGSAASFPRSQQATPNLSFLGDKFFYSSKHSSKHSRSKKRNKTRLNYQKRNLGDHPNHIAFCNHTGVPLSDLLFSSYVDPFPNKSKHSNSRILKTKYRAKRRDFDELPASSKEKPSHSSHDNEFAEGESHVTLLSSAFQWPLNVAKSSVSYVSSFLPPLLPAGFSFNQHAQEKVEPKQGTPSLHHKRFKPRHAPNRKPEPLSASHSYFGHRDVHCRDPSIHAPVHFIAVDKATKSVVLAIRGTLGVSDFFIDLMCTYKQIVLTNHPESKQTQFKVHSGMWKSACLLASPKSEIFLEICEALRRFPSYGLVLCGHSLGGGVAALLSILWSRPVLSESSPNESLDSPSSARDNKSHTKNRFVTSSLFGLVSDRPIGCYSYGSPCVVNSDLSRYSENLITSIVNSNDVFSHLSIGSMVDLLAVTTTLDKERKTVEKIVKSAYERQKSSFLEKVNPFNIDMSNLGGIYGDEDDEDDEDLGYNESYRSDGGQSDNSHERSNTSNSSGDENQEPTGQKGGSNIVKLKQKGENYLDSFAKSYSGVEMDADVSPSPGKTNRSKNRSSYQIVTEHPLFISTGVSSLLNRLNPVNYLANLPSAYLGNLSPFANKPAVPEKKIKKKTACKKSKTSSIALDNLKNSIKDLENWHLSVVKTMRAGMDHEKLYPPGLIYVLEQESNDNEQMDLGAEQRKGRFANNFYNLNGIGGGLMHYIFPNFANTTKKIRLSRCNDVLKSFSELRFAPNMFISHYPQVYEYNIGALVHSSSI